MRNFYSDIILCLIFFFTVLPAAEEFTVDQVKRNLDDQFIQADDFIVDIKLSVKMSGLRMPKKKVTLYFKNPDLFKIESKGFALVPQYGLPMSPDVLLSSLSDISIESADDTPGGCFLHGNIQLGIDKNNIWKFSDTDDHSMTMKIYIDTQKWIIPYFEIYTSGSKILRVESNFRRYAPGVYLPERTQIELDIPELDEDTRFHMREGNAPQKGTITLQYQNYRINQGIKENFFEDEPE